MVNLEDQEVNFRSHTGRYMEMVRLLKKRPAVKPTQEDVRLIQDGEFVPHREMTHKEAQVHISLLLSNGLGNDTEQNWRVGTEVKVPEFKRREDGEQRVTGYGVADVLALSDRGCAIVVEVKNSGLHQTHRQLRRYEDMLYSGANHVLSAYYFTRLMHGKKRDDEGEYCYALERADVWPVWFMPGCRQMFPGTDFWMVRENRYDIKEGL
jgi:hypothetical protein